MHWWPRQTPSSGMLGPNRSTTALEIPASLGVHGPGEMINRVGRMASISSSVIRSLRTTCKSSPGSISPRRWTRL